VGYDGEGPSAAASDDSSSNAAGSSDGSDVDVNNVVVVQFQRAAAQHAQREREMHAALHDLTTQVFEAAQRVLAAPCWLPGCAFPGCGFWDSASQMTLVTNARRAVCGGCGVARYCCRACARADWGWRHQKVCSSLRRELQEAAAAAAAAGAASTAAEAEAQQQEACPVAAAGSTSSNHDTTTTTSSSSSNSSNSNTTVAGAQPAGPSNGQPQQQQQRLPVRHVKVWPGMLAFALQQDATGCA
jgi:hypothetical protein